MRSPALLVPLMLSACAGTAAHKLALCDDPARLMPPPAQVWDDGQSTFFRFPGNQRVPVPYVIQPDGTEALGSYTVSADGHDHILMLHQTAREIRLRDGDAIACVANRSWTPGGVNPGTGTTSPDFVRVLKGEPS